MQMTKKTCMDLLCKLFEMRMFFGPIWNKIFKVDIIKNNNLTFNEKINYREDELFTFQYCKYIETARVLPTLTYNYRKTANSLMRVQYHDPKMVFYVVDNSYNAAIQLPVNDKFKKIIDYYYTDSLVYCGRLAYINKHLQDRQFRIKIQKMIYRRNKANPTKESLRFSPFTPILSDFCHLLQYAIRAVFSYNH